MVNQILKAQNAIKIIILFLITSCAINKINSKDKLITDQYSLMRYKSKKNYDTQVIIKCYDYENRKERITQAAIIVNNILLNSGKISVSSGRHTFKIGYLGKKTIKINKLIVKAGDSIVLNAYLKDSNHAIEDYN